jgi:DNA-binding response OmpR family regulator
VNSDAGVVKRPGEATVVMAKILLLEDDVKYARVIKDYLGSLSHAVDITANIENARTYLNTYQYEVLIVDWNLPDGDGASFVESLRRQGCMTPTLMLTARETICDKERGFGAGVDDYLTKDSNPRELALRITSLLRRPSSYKDNKVQFQKLQIDFNTRSVTKDGKPIHLLPKEYLVLEFLCRYPNRIFSADELLERLWPSDTEATTHTVRSAINKLRTKLDDPDEPSLILTRYKAGYQWNSPDGLER